MRGGVHVAGNGAGSGGAVNLSSGEAVGKVEAAQLAEGKSAMLSPLACEEKQGGRAETGGEAQCDGGERDS